MRLNLFKGRFKKTLSPEELIAFGDSIGPPPIRPKEPPIFGTDKCYLFRWIPECHTRPSGGGRVVFWLGRSTDNKKLVRVAQIIARCGIATDWSVCGPLYYRSWRHNWLGRLLKPGRKAKGTNNARRHTGLHLER